MSRSIRSDRFPRISRVLMVGVVSGLAAACSSDTMRFASDPFGNPFGARQAEPTMTGSIDAGPQASAGVIEATPLREPGASAPMQTGPAQEAVARQQQQQQQRRASGPAGWTALGGTPVVVRQGEDLSRLANRYNVPASAILEANNLSREADIRPGSTVVIPVYNAVDTRVASAQPAAPAQTSQPARQAQSSERSTASQATSEQLNVTPPPRPQSIGQRATEQNRQAPAPSQPERSETASTSPAPAQPAPQQQASLQQPAPRTESSVADADGLDFRWPARGRVIAGFGTGGNEGINIALPEGTPVRAAEGGTVAYAGSELKGYGNLILIRHENGYVSAYAHNRDLLVSRGDTVRRGQVIANSGRTGNVNAPQLHFEIRKGSDPVDPMPYLRS